MRTIGGTVLVSLVMSGGAVAQEIEVSDPGAVREVASPLSPEFGQGNSILALTAWDAHPMSSNTTYNYGETFGTAAGIYRTGGDPWFKLPVHLPSGALVTQVEIAFCDTGPSSALLVHWIRQPSSRVRSSTLKS